MGHIRAFFVFTKRDGSRDIKEFPRTKAAPLNFFYETIQVFLSTSLDLELSAISWGDEGREIDLQPVDVRSEQFFADVCFEEAPNDHWFCSESRNHKTFINHLMFGEFAIEVLLNDSVIHLGRFSRSTIVAGTSNLPLQHYLNICSVVYGSYHGLIADESLRSKSNVHLFVRSGVPPRPLAQIMWFYRQLAPIVKGVISGETLLPTSLGEVREVRPYSHGVRLDGQSINRLVAGGVTPPHRMSTKNLGGAFIPATVDIPNTKSRFSQLDNQLLIQVLAEIYTGLRTFIEDLNLTEGALRRRADTFGHYISTLCRRYKINRDSGLVVGLPDKYIRSADPQLKRLGSLIAEWNSYYQLDMGERGHTHLYSVHTTELLWEFFCFEKLVRALNAAGFVEEKRQENRIVLFRGEVEVAIKYVGVWKSGSQMLGLRNLHLTKQLEPDYVITLTGPDFERVGVMDAKYTPDPLDWQQRSGELFQKYGLYLRKPSYNTLDYVMGLVPSAVAGERHRLLKVGQTGDLDL
ncbi:hypothetical protein N9V98_08400, partial [Luminiphilus sp.]|nr:hypothetical protein [Luminiphilus sp.]